MRPSMKEFWSNGAAPSFLFLLLVAFASFVPAAALAYPGGGHFWGAEAATELFGVGPSHPTADPMEISRNRPVPLVPELELVTEWYDTKEGCCDEEYRMTRANWDWLRYAAQELDDYDSNTLHHFWYVQEGLHEDPYGIAGMNNAWEEIQSYWLMALITWQGGNLGEAYSNLGYALHLIQDMGQPAHANEDPHPADDALEEWFTGEYARAIFIWNRSDLNSWPGPILHPPTDNNAIRDEILNRGFTPDYDNYPEDVLLFDPANNVFNIPQVFYMLYTVNQTANWFASDNYEGDSYDPIGWLGGYPGFPATFSDGSSIHQPSALDNNDDCDCDVDGDLSLIARWGYGASFRAGPGFIDLFRRTVDNVPPVTTFEISRADGKPVVEWNNSPVRVVLTGATDSGNPGMLRAANVWKVWGKVDGETPNFTPDPEHVPYWTISRDGVHQVELLSTDMVGNVETGERDFTVKMDMTPPVVAFPGLRPNYLTSESFTATWTATDATSGVDSEVAYLDGNVVVKGQVFDLALLAGLHSLRVIVYDKAGNWIDVNYDFEVWIDANGWCQSTIVNNKTQGNALTCVVEFPEPYDVGLVSLNASTVAVKGTLDLAQNDPVIGELADLQGQLLTGVGDHDRDGIPDRKILFRKDQFVAALSGQTGPIPSIVRGGLLPDGLPRFIAEVTVPLFRSPGK